MPALEALDGIARPLRKDEESGQCEQDQSGAVAEEGAKRLKWIQWNAGEADRRLDHVNLARVSLFKPDGLRSVLRMWAFESDRRGERGCERLRPLGPDGDVRQ